MSDLEPSWRRTLSRVVLGLMLGAAVYIIMESLGFGSSRRQRQITFLLPQPTSQIEVLYLSGDDILRRATLPTPNAKATDDTQLPAGHYELEIFLSRPEQSTVSKRELDLGEAETLTIDLRRE